MGITINKPAALIAGAGNTSGGAQLFGNWSDTELAVGSNSIFEIGGTLYQLVAQGAGTGNPAYNPRPVVFQWYSSTDGGTTWSTYGAGQALGIGVGMAQTLDADGVTIWVCYTGQGAIVGTVVIRPFNTSTATWGTQQTYDPNTGVGFTQIDPLGPIDAYTRPDGTLALIYGDDNNSVITAIVYSPLGNTFTRVYLVIPAGGTGITFMSSLLAADGTVHVFYNKISDHTYHHIALNTDNSVAADVVMHTGADISDFVMGPGTGGLGYGVLSGGVFYLGAGIVNGSDVDAGILYGNDSGGWTLGNILDTTVGAGWKVYDSPAIFLSGSTLIYWVRYVNGAGSHYIDRVGTAALADFNTPANWTWVTAYDFAVSTPAVPGETGPYTPANFETTRNGLGNVSGVIQSASGHLRLVTSLINNGGGVFTTFLLDIVAAAPAPVADCNNPLPGYVGRNYSHAFGASGGTPPYTFSKAAGAFPAGLTLNAATGVLSGKCTLAGVFNFTLEVTDSAAQSGTVDCSIAVFQTAVFAGGGGGARPSKCGCSPQQLEAERVRQLRRRRGAWPYEYLFPPDGAVPVEQVGGITAPGAGNSATVFEYRVPAGSWFVMLAIVQDFAGASFTTGAAVWTVDQNTGAPNVQASPVQGLTGVPVRLGSFANGAQWGFEYPYIFAPLTRLRSRVLDVSLGGGAFTSGFFGYLLPDVRKGR